MSEKPAVGLIGLGLMGRGIGANLLKAGHPLFVVAGPKRTSVDELISLGAQKVARPIELAERCNIVLTALPDSTIVQQVATGKDGLLHGARPGFTHVDLTSGDPSVTRNLARLYAERGFTLVDAGMSGMPEVAQAGELNLMIGSDSDATVESLRPVLSTFARQILKVGPSGAGHTTKLIIGFMGMAIANASAEIFTLARATGIDIESIRHLIGESGMDSRTFQSMAIAAIDGNVSRRKLTIGNARKDLSYLVNMLNTQGIATSIAPATLQSLTLASTLGHSTNFVPALTGILGDLNGIKVGE